MATPLAILRGTVLESYREAYFREHSSLPQLLAAALERQGSGADPTQLLVLTRSPLAHLGTALEAAGSSSQEGVPRAVWPPHQVVHLLDVDSELTRTCRDGLSLMWLEGMRCSQCCPGWSRSRLESGGFLR